MSGVLAAAIAAAFAPAGGGGSQVATDPFAGSNGDPLSGSWTTLWGAFQIHTSACNPNSTSASCAAYWNANTLNDRQYAEMTLPALASGVFVGPAVRMQTTAGASQRTYASAVCDGSAMYVSTFVNDSQNVIAGPITSPAATDVLRIEADGTTVRVYVNGVLGGRTYNSVTGLQASGRAGVDGYSSGTGTRGDDWKCGNL